MVGKTFAPSGTGLVRRTVFRLMMKRLALTLLALAVLTAGASAQTDPFGQIDTLYLDQVTAGAGQECIVRVNAFTDEDLGGVTIPLIYPTSKLEVIEVSFAGGRLDYIGTKPVTIDTIAGTVLVGAIVFVESYIAPGNGPFFQIRFRVKEGLTPGDAVTIDSTRIPPAYLLLTHSSATNIFPAFRAGKITVAESNRPPQFTPVGDQHYVAEGDSIVLNLQVTDPDGNPVLITNPIHPRGSRFTDNGDGTARFVWSPDFVGPLSSTGNPFRCVFRAGDGQLSRSIETNINAINVNRPPQISVPGTVQGEAGDSMNIAVSCTDPDFDIIEWNLAGMPAGASFNFTNPGQIAWQSAFADSGNHDIQLMATDPFGLADTATVNITMAPVVLLAMRIDTATTFAGHTLEIGVGLKNRLDVKEFNLLINLDASILTVLEVTNSSTRTEGFEFFQYRINENSVPGDLRIMGKADVAGAPTGPPLASGDGPVFRILVQVSPNLLYVGNQVPIQFVRRAPSDNTLLLGTGEVAGVGLVTYHNGSILIASPGPNDLGDINLNGLTFEISDAVYFSNFYISPSLYPLNDQQVLNSDINQDGMAPSVADLVHMIQIIAGAIEPPVGKVLPVPGSGTVELLRNENGLFVATTSPATIGGAYFRLQGKDIDLIEPENMTEMQLKADVSDDRFNCLLVSFEQKTISAGQATVVKLADDPNLDVVLEAVDLADAGGRVIHTEIKESTMVPAQFTLHQNSPNPFNPTTEIRFDLASPQRVRLSIFNILGQEIIRLADREYPAGSHTVTWEGTDDQGHPAASGIYFYRIEAGSFTASRKMVLMK